MAWTLTTLVVAPALAWVVVSDLLYRRIGNALVLALLLLWLAYGGWTLAAQHGGAGQRASLLAGALTAAAVLAIGYLLFALRWMGAGDAKLMAVLCLWLGEQALTFLIVATLAGGVLALGMPLLQAFEKALALGLMRVNAWLPRPAIPVPQALRSEPASGIPYGLAIAFGAAFVLWSGP